MCHFLCNELYNLLILINHLKYKIIFSRLFSSKDNKIFKIEIKYCLKTLS